MFILLKILAKYVFTFEDKLHKVIFHNLILKMTTKNIKEIINKTNFYHSLEINDYKIKEFYN